MPLLLFALLAIFSVKAYLQTPPPKPETDSASSLMPVDLPASRRLI